MRNRFGLGSGFTLIELSVVLVVIGLIVGGILVGRELIHAAAVRAQLSQIETYNQAINAFRTKYGYLPGDIKDPEASNFGFVARGTLPGQGDANGVIQGFWSGSGACGICSAGGENVVAWSDLSHASLIEGSFTTARSDDSAPSFGGAPVNLLLPKAKIGDNNYVYIYSSCTYSYQNGIIGCYGNGPNYFAISAFGYIQQDNGLRSAAGFSVSDAYNMDKKIDDGLPQNGRVLTRGISAVLQWSTGNVIIPNVVNAGGPNSGSAAAASATSCYDNGGDASMPFTYSIQILGSALNCDLSFAMQ